MVQMEMKCIFHIGKNISFMVKVTQVSDVACGPLVFSSPELKAQVSFSDRFLSVVRLSVCRLSVNFSHF
jgi:hypothetical protein